MEGQMSIYEYIKIPLRWPTADHKAIDVLLSHKYGHMMKMQYANPSFAGCPIDDYTNAIDRAVLSLNEKIKKSETDTGCS